MAKLLAVAVVAAVVAVCNGQGYGGVPQAAKGVRTTTTFAPDVIPSDKQAEIFYQKNPNPEDIPRPAAPQYNQPNPSVPQHSNPNPSIPQYNKPNPSVPQYNKPNPGVPQHSNPNPGVPQHSNPNPGVPQNSNPQPVGQYPGPLPDNSIYAGSFTDSQGSGGNFWWMNQDNPFKGADVPPQPPKGSNPPPSSGPAPGSAPLPPHNNPNNPFLTGGVKPSGPYPAPGGNNPAPIVNNPPPHSGNNPNNPFLSGGVKPSGPYPNPSGSNPPPSAVNPGNPFISGGGNKDQGCGGSSGCGSQAPQGESYPGNQGIPCTGPGYLCVSKSNCNNGIVVDNGLVAKAGVQRCDAVTQTCCRLPSRPNYPGGNYPGGNGPVKPTGGNPPYQGNPAYQGQGSAPGTNGVPIGGSIYDRPVTPNPVITPYTGPLNVTPYPGCAAALKCVEIIYCTAEGVMVDTPQALTREQEENRVPLSECSNPDTGILGKCCRDPNYKDPWPGGMMMHVHHDGDHGGQFVDQQGFPTGQYDASQGAPSQQQFNQQPPNVNVPKPFPQKPFQPQPAPQQNFQPTPPQYRPQPQQPLPQQPQPQPTYQPQQNVPQYQPQQNNPRPNVPPQDYNPQFPQGSQNVPKPQPFPQGSQNVPQPQPFPQQPPPAQNFQKPAPQPIVPQYQAQKPDLPAWQPTQVNFASQTPEKVPYQPAPGYPSAPQQQFEPAQSFPNAAASDTRCGIKGNVDRSGISDLDVAEGEFPWHAMILNSADGKPLCAAAVVSDRAVLTAAHCVNNLESREISVSIGGIRLGGRQSAYPVEAIARHPKFDAVSQFNDLAVVFLKQSGSGLRPICLPENSGVVGGKCFATGYSRKAMQSNSGSLHQVQVYSVPRDVCEEKLKATNLGKYYSLNPSFTCALPTNPQSSLCKVGAGSPISCERSGVYHLGGTYSWDVGCTQEETPAALAVPDVDWIRSVISRPIQDVLREEQNEIEKRKASQEVVDSESKPGFSQGYGK